MPSPLTAETSSLLNGMKSSFHMILKIDTCRSYAFHGPQCLSEAATEVSDLDIEPAARIRTSILVCTRSRAQRWEPIPQELALA